MKKLSLNENEYALIGHIIALKIDDLSDEIDSRLNDKDYNGFPDNYLIDRIDLFNTLNYIYETYFK